MDERVPAVLKLVSISAGYKKDNVVLKDVNLELPGRQLVSIIGPNGAGKTTLLRVIAGVLKPVKGKVLLDGSDIYEMNPHERSRLVTYLPAESSEMPGLYVEEYLFSARIPWITGIWESSKDIVLVSEIVDKLGLTNLLRRRMNELSSGEKRRVQIAWCILREADILLFDEPTVHLDPSYQSWVINMLREIAREKLVLVAMHDINLALAYSDLVVGIKNGKLVFSRNPKSITKEDLEKLYDTRLLEVRDKLSNTSYYLPLAHGKHVLV